MMTNLFFTIEIEKLVTVLHEEEEDNDGSRRLCTGGHSNLV